MKIERKTPPNAFVPFVITFETLEEVQILKALYGNVEGYGPSRKITSALYGVLDNAEIVSAEYHITSRKAFLFDGDRA